jgi:hypothetical protein
MRCRAWPRYDRGRGQAPAPRAPRPAAAVHRARGARRHRASQRQSARLPDLVVPARRPDHGCPAHVALPLARRCRWPRRATICGASCACSIRLPQRRRSCASASRGRSTTWATSTGRRLARAFVKEVGRAAIDLYGGNLRVTEAQLTGTSRPPRAKTRDRRKRETPSPFAFWWQARPVPASRASSTALANAVEAAVDLAAGNRRFHRLPADARGPADGA